VFYLGLRKKKGRSKKKHQKGGEEDRGKGRRVIRYKNWSSIQIVKYVPTAASRVKIGAGQKVFDRQLQISHTQSFNFGRFFPKRGFYLQILHF